MKKSADENFLEEIPKVGTKDFNNLSKEMFSGKPKQETLEEAAERLYSDKEYPMYGATRRYGFINGAKWQQERSYSEEEVKEAIRFGFDKGFCSNSRNKVKNLGLSEQEWFEQFKNK
jgi:hypothetical protein